MEKETERLASSQMLVKFILKLASVAKSFLAEVDEQMGNDNTGICDFL